MREEFEQYYRENYDTLCKSMASRVGGLYNSEDVIQEAALRALRYIDSFDPSRSEMSTWFGKIARRAMYDFKRQETQQGLVREESSGEEPITYLPEAEVRAQSEIEQEIEKKRDNHRDILRLAIVKGYRPREIVEVVDESLHNINFILATFKKEMKEKYGVN